MRPTSEHYRISTARNPKPLRVIKKGSTLEVNRRARSVGPWRLERRGDEAGRVGALDGTVINCSVAKISTKYAHAPAIGGSTVAQQAILGEVTGSIFSSHEIRREPSPARISSVDRSRQVGSIGQRKSMTIVNPPGPFRGMREREARTVNVHSARTSARGDGRGGAAGICR